MFEVSVVRTFCSAHRLRGYRGKCEDLHGHNWRVEVGATADALNELGMVIDFGELKKALDEVLAGLDHRYLNECPPFDAINPSSENLAKFIFDETARRLEGRPARLVRCRVWESDNSYSTYQP